VPVYGPGSDFARSGFAFASSCTTIDRLRFNPLLRVSANEGAGPGRNGLAISSSRADGDDQSAIAELDPLDRDHDAEHLRLEGQRQMFFEHGEPAAGLLGNVVGVDRRLFAEAHGTLMLEFFFVMRD
jgi:hypothetical protein